MDRRPQIKFLYPYVAAQYAKVVADMKAEGLRLNPNNPERARAWELMITETVRTLGRQAELYAQGRTAPGSIVTNAKPGYSLHHYGSAIDVRFAGAVPYPQYVWAKDKWDFFMARAEEYGFVCGGKFLNFRDLPHIEMRFGLTLDQMKAAYEKGNSLYDVWAMFDKQRGVKTGEDWFGTIAAADAWLKK